MCTHGAYVNCSFSPSPMTKIIYQQEADILLSLLKMEQKYRKEKTASKAPDEHCQLGILSASTPQMQ